MYLFTYVKQKAPGNREVLRSVYSCGFSGQSTAVGSQVSLQLGLSRQSTAVGSQVSLQLGLSGQSTAGVIRSVYSCGFSDQSTAVGSQHGTCFMSPFLRLQFGSGSKNLSNI